MVLKIGKYEVGKPSGNRYSTFIRASLATDTESGETVVLKRIKKESFRDPKSSENHFQQIKRLRHPCLVCIRELLQTEKEYIVVMGALPGGELLDKVVGTRRFDEATARAYFQQLVAGVHYCHLNGVTNRDLKDGNLLVDEHGRLKITDTAISCEALALYLGRPPPVLSGLCPPIPPCIPPEALKEMQSNGSETDWFKADVWSCGVILYVMLSGAWPFDSPRINEMFLRIERGDYRMWRSMPPGAADLIQTMLVVDPRQRASLEDIMHHPWFAEGFDPALMGHAVEVGKDPPSIPHVEYQNMAVDRPVPDALRIGPPLDAMQLMSHMAAHHLTPLTASNNPSKSGGSSIMFKGSVCDIVSELDAMKGNPKLKDGSSEIKGFAHGSQLMTYRLVVLQTTATGLTFGRIERGRGDSKDFAEFVSELRERVRRRT